jgi:hypothetical protein
MTVGIRELSDVGELVQLEPCGSSCTATTGP